MLHHMRSELLPFDINPSAFFPPPLKPLVRPIEPALIRHFLPDTLCQSYTAADPLHSSAFDFADSMMRRLDIAYAVDSNDVDRIPATGACLVVANHPFGLLEGFILIKLLESIRPDYRIVANTLLASTPALHQRVIFVNPFEGANVRENGRGLRLSLDHLRQGGLLVMFPAGEVASFKWDERAIRDCKWNTAAARLARKAGCPALPLFFKGANSLPFQMLGAIHPRLRTLNLARELVKKRKHRIHLRIGTPIPAAVLAGYPDAGSATDYLRARTYLLDDRSSGLPPMKAAVETTQLTVVSQSAAEIASLSEDSVLAANSDFKVVLAAADQIPHTLKEIGRAREETYREIGEGTGRALDLDEFDSYYQHMILWSIHDQCVAGAYRLTTTPDVLSKYGPKGLYTNTLFQYEPDFFTRIGPSVELGRSFIRRRYQKHYSSLLLLWKGIAQFAARHPHCPVLFGAVSISSEYHLLSRTLIVNFLNAHLAGNPLASLVKPRCGFRASRFVPKHIHTLAQLLTNVEELSSSVQDLEPDGKGLPVLIRQYLKLGGQLLAFNVDPLFSNSLDALVVADLRTASAPMLDRCMGRAAAAAFRAYHAQPHRA